MAREYDRARSPPPPAAAPGSGSAPPVSFPKRFTFRGRSKSRPRSQVDLPPNKLDCPPESHDTSLSGTTDADRSTHQGRGRSNRTVSHSGSRTGHASPAPDPSSKLRRRNASRDPGLSADEHEGNGVFKRVTTQIRRHMSGALPTHSSARASQGPAPPLPNSFTSKQLREQALRERGLLPPLPTTRDLSEQEAARDTHKTHVKPLTDEEAGRGEKTAAMLIREEYQARERQGSSRSVASSDDSAASRMVDVTGSVAEPEDETSTVVPTPFTEMSEFAVTYATPTTPTQSFPLPPQPSTRGSFSDRFARLPPPPTRKPPPPPIHTASTPKDLPALPSLGLEVPTARPALNKSNSTSTRRTSSSEVPSLTRSTSNAPSASSSLPSPTSPTAVEMHDMRRPPIDGSISEATFSPLQRIAEMELQAGYDEHGAARGSRREKSKTLPLLPMSSAAVSRTSVASSASEKRRSFTLFGRKSSGSVSDLEGPKLRKTSLSSLRRALETSRRDHHHHHPPSSFSAYADESRRPGVGRRVPLNPTMHNRGSIVMETRGIEDVESRRLSEMAFLD